MLKKILLSSCLFSCCISIYADSFTKAIIRTDVAAVSEMLQNDPLSAQEKEAFLDLAQETIVALRQKMDRQILSAIRNLLVVGASATMITLVKPQIDDNKWFAALGLTVCLYYSFTAIWSFYKGTNLGNELTGKYNDALVVKQLLWLAKTKA
jgi:spore coat polysaccharide biosynthesis predicted glycosyltransferase SpsG